MNRWISMVILIAFLTTPLTALAQGDRAGDPFWNPTDEQLAAWRTIDGVEEGAEIVFWTMALSPVFDDYLNTLVENFEATYPEVDLIWQDQPWDSLRDTVREGLAAGEIADVINISPEWIAEFAEAGALLDMDAALADYPELRAQYADGAWLTSAYKGISYQIPWYLGLRNFMAYNTAILDELGVDPADLPTTFEELAEFARMVRENSDYYAFSQNWGELSGYGIVGSLPYSFVQDTDIPIFNDGSTEVVFNTEESAARLQTMVDLIANDAIPRESISDDLRQMIYRFSDEQTAILLAAPPLLRLVADGNPDVYASLGIAPGVTGNSGANSIDVQSLVVPATTTYPNAALALATFVTNPEAQAAFSKEVGVFPSNLMSYEDHFFQTVEPDDLLSQIRPLAYDYVVSAENRSISFPDSAQVELVIREETEAALREDKTAQEALDSMVARINEILAAAE